MKKLTNEKGQALLEIVVALAVVVIVVSALVKLITISIKNASFARNESLATKYAQEAIEKVRAYRDENTWDAFVSSCSSKPDLGLSDPPPPFSLLPISCADSGDSRTVKVTVSWTDAQGTHESELTTYLTNWQ